MDILQQDDVGKYMHAVNNLTCAATVVLSHIYVAAQLFIMGKKVSGESAAARSIAEKERMITLQCMIICLGTLMATLFYISCQFFPVPDWYNDMANMMWIFDHGGRCKY